MMLTNTSKYDTCSRAIFKEFFRIKNMLHTIISPDQTDFIPERYIGENTRLIYDLRQYAEENDIHGVLLMIDFE